MSTDEKIINYDKLSRLVRQCEIKCQDSNKKEAEELRKETYKAIKKIVWG